MSAAETLSREHPPRVCIPQRGPRDDHDCVLASLLPGFREFVRASVPADGGLRPLRAPDAGEHAED
ncbi:hypothetical protein GCM10023086_75800 [Streptomyces venetus]|uniref:Uncharacterized protein n=1 Tax=Streptomyces venetus TaxID=1701086 RepID=A0ABP8HJN4_9ACTN